MSILDISPVIPVVTLDDQESAVPLAQALVAGGVGIIEVTLRTTAALECIRRIAREVPEIVVGAGTVTSPQEAEAAARIGAAFLVSPGATPAVAAAMRDSGLPSLPGCSTVSEALALRDFGFEELKFFPAEAAGGPAFLAAIQGPLPTLRFCATGSITLDRAPAYLALPNVPCIGASWLARPSAIAEGAWDAVTAECKTALDSVV